MPKTIPKILRYPFLVIVVHCLTMSGIAVCWNAVYCIQV
jgi:hypothetical protein